MGVITVKQIVLEVPVSWHLAGHKKFSMNRRLESVFVILRLYNKFQSSTVLGTDQKVVVWLVDVFVFVFF